MALLCWANYNMAIEKLYNDGPIGPLHKEDTYRDTPFWESVYSKIEKADEVVERVYPAFIGGALLYLFFHVTIWIWRGF